jgi:hypothetical protein
VCVQQEAENGVGHSATSDLIKNDVIFECNETVLKQQEILKREIQDCLQMLSKVKIWIQVAPSGARAPHSFPAPRGMTARPARTLPEMTPRPSRFFPLHPRTAQHPKSRGRQQLWRVHPGLGCRVQGAGRGIRGCGAEWQPLGCVDARGT